MKTNNPFLDNLIEAQTNVVNNWVDTTKKVQAAITSGSISHEGQNIYKDWYEKQMGLIGGMQPNAGGFFGNENKPEEFFKNWYNQQLGQVKQMTDFNQSIYNSYANFGKPATDYVNGFNTANTAWTNIYNSWTNTLNTAYDTYSKNFSTPFNQDVFKNLFDSNTVYLKAQEAFQPMLKAIQANDFSAETWKNIYNVDKYKALNEQLFGSFFNGGTIKDVYEKATKQVQNFFVNQNGLSKEYYEQLKNMGTEFPQLFSGNFAKIKDLYSNVNNVFAKTFEPVLKLVSPGKEKENTEAALALMDKIAEYVIKQNELQVALSASTQKSVEAIAKQYAEKYKNAKPGEFPAFNEVYNDWVKTNEQFLAELFATEEFSKIKAETLSLSMDVKKQFEKQFENVFENYPVVFRSEIEELYKTIYDLKKTVKDLQTKLALNTTELFEDDKASKTRKK
ncbi:MAG: poly(R)-hydroxyalkanoic acid synthase subunit PhaE [Bacteroidia bacterium]